MRSWLRHHVPTLCGASLCAVLLPSLAPQVSSEQFSVLRTAFVVVFLVISLSIHEVAHAWVANQCGDSTAKDLGRITLNPLAHIGLFETILLPVMMLILSNGAFAFGGAKPVPVSYHRLRHPLRDMMFVAIAGPLSNVALAVLFYLGWKCSVYIGEYQGSDLLPQVLGMSMYTNLVLAAFNMLPVPPLDGSRVLAWLLPSALREPYVQLERFGLLMVIGVWYLVPGVKSLVFNGVHQMEALIDFLTGGPW